MFSCVLLFCLLFLNPKSICLQNSQIDAWLAAVNESVPKVMELLRLRDMSGRSSRDIHAELCRHWQPKAMAGYTYDYDVLLPKLLRSSRLDQGFPETESSESGVLVPPPHPAEGSLPPPVSSQPPPPAEGSLPPSVPSQPPPPAVGSQPPPQSPPLPNCPPLASSSPKIKTTPLPFQESLRERREAIFKQGMYIYTTFLLLMFFNYCSAPSS